MHLARASLVVAFGIMLVGLAGCLTGSGEENKLEVKLNGGGADGKTYTITYFDGFDALVVPPPDGPGITMINEKFHVDYQPELVPMANYTSKLTIRMASGNIPDVIGMQSANSNYYKWAKQGAFLPLDPYVQQYPTLQQVPEYIWDSMRVDGKIYGIPRYYTTVFGKLPIIRQDWLERLGLDMPTNFEELIRVAVAFAKNDPDGNGIDDTYGLGISRDIQYKYDFGAYWNPNAWYHRNEEGQIIPGVIAEANQERIRMLATLYKEGAISKDWPVSKESDVKNAFYNGKIGIYYEAAYDMGALNYRRLQEVQPNAKLAAIPPFKAPDGSQGFLGLKGYYQLLTLSSRLEDDPGKVHRFLKMLDYFRTFIPLDRRTPDNPDFDWQNGRLGVGYYNTAEGGQENMPFEKGLLPKFYVEPRYWSPNEQANEVVEATKDPLQKIVNAQMENNAKRFPTYLNPSHRLQSDTYNDHWSALNQLAIDWHTKMIVGQAELDDWDVMVQDFMNYGGKQLIDDVNRAMKQADVRGEWKAWE